MPEAPEIILDLLGSDSAPAPELGAIRIFLSSENFLSSDIRLAVVGDISALSQVPEHPRIRKIDAAKGIPMNVSPSFALRHYTDSTVSIGLSTLAQSTKSVFLSAGNTGAILAFSIKHLSRLEEIPRPGIAVILPDKLNNRILIDCGANADCKPEFLYGFALLGVSLAKHLLKKGEPLVGLLNIGEEATKGDKLRKESFESLEKLGKQFYGNVEPHDLFYSPVDVIVMDGFTGNIVLKTLEGAFDFIAKFLGKTLKSGTFSEKLGAFLIKKKVRDAFSEFKYQEYGAALLAGLSHPVLIAHGRSDETALFNALKYATNILNAGLFSEFETIKKELPSEVKKDKKAKDSLF